LGKADDSLDLGTPNNNEEDGKLDQDQMVTKPDDEQSQQSHPSPETERAQVMEMINKLCEN
jgi:hypothetical protein